MKWWILLVGLSGVALWDWYKKEIFLPVLAGMACIGILFSMETGGDEIKSALLGVFPGVFLLLVSFVTQGAVGEGDGWLLAAVGTYMGAMMAWFLFLLATCLAMLAGIVLIGCRWANGKTRIPWAPFVWVGYVILWIGGVFV